MWVAVTMGIITGAFGGMLRDILLNNEPLLFKKDIYATACFIGGIIYWIALGAGLAMPWPGILCAATVIITRILAVQLGLSLPVLSEAFTDSENTPHPSDHIKS